MLIRLVVHCKAKLQILILENIKKTNLKSVSKTIRKPPLAEAQSALGTKINKYGEKRFSIWRMDFFHPAMWHVALG